MISQTFEIIIKIEWYSINLIKLKIDVFEMLFRDYILRYGPTYLVFNNMRNVDVGKNRRDLWTIANWNSVRLLLRFCSLTMPYWNIVVWPNYTEPYYKRIVALVSIILMLKSFEVTINRWPDSHIIRSTYVSVCMANNNDPF